MHLRLAITALLILAGCASPDTMPGIVQATSSALLLGEQHDAPEHPRFQREAIEALAARGVLAAVALEMAEQGASTASLPPAATEDQVRQTLRWDDRAWPWSRYAAAVMAAVAAGVPVAGANLPREQMKPSMQDASLDTLLPAAAFNGQIDAIRTGHCGLLSEEQLRPMARVQVARDRAMAQTLQSLAQPGKTVVLISGAGHADRSLGVPRHLPARFENRSVVLPIPLEPAADYCAQMRRMVTTPGP